MGVSSLQKTKRGYQIKHRSGSDETTALPVWLPYKLGHFFFFSILRLMVKTFTYQFGHEYNHGFWSGVNLKRSIYLRPDWYCTSSSPLTHMFYYFIMYLVWTAVAAATLVVLPADNATYMFQSATWIKYILCYHTSTQCATAVTNLLFWRIRLATYCGGVNVDHI